MIGWGRSQWLQPGFGFDPRPKATLAWYFLRLSDASCADVDRAAQAGHDSRTGRVTAAKFSADLQPDREPALLDRKRPV
jgi:hypothetical protein